MQQSNDVISVWTLLAAFGLALFVFGFALGNHIAKRNFEPIIRTDTLVVTQTIHDTTKLVQWRERVRVDTCYLALVPDPADTASAVSADSAIVQIPIEQKVYETENYRAVIEGFRPELVSMDIYKKTEYITIEKQLAPKKWTFGVSFGASAGLYYTPKGIQPGAGLGATIGATYHF